ncbi:MAG: M20 family metallopeptidase [Chloroflexota bacterium]
MTTDRLKKRVCKEVERQRDALVRLSLLIHANPELGFQEVQATGWLTDYLESNGFRVARGVAGLPTAFTASYGSGSPVIGILAEYDALPKLGHACGHNLIGTSAVGAGVALKSVIDGVGGKVVVLGTPAEELHGGKAIMAERGIFNDLDAAMIAHPGVRDTATSWALACIGLDIEFFGKASHAAARPDDGINALEAMIQSFNSINSLRQHIRDKARVHGIITDGGEAANIVPSHSAGYFLVRAEDDDYLQRLRLRVLDCFKGAAQATGARLEYRWAEVKYAAMRSNESLAELFSKNMESLGRKTVPRDPNRGMGSTDMGNVSVLVPSIHPSVAIAPTTVLGHSTEFAQAAASPEGQKGLLDAAKAMAMTAVDLLAKPETMARVRDEFLRGEV